MSGLGLVPWRDSALSLMRFSLNVSILFQELPYLERFSAAREAGFDAVETWWHRTEDPDAVAAAITDAGVAVVVMNADAGDMPAGDRGLLSDPNRESEFAESMPVTIDLARRVGAHNMNALIGHAIPGMARTEQLALATANLQRLAKATEPHGITVLIEAVNTIENGPYLISTTEQAETLRAMVDRPNVRLLYDAYHMQRMEGDLVTTLRRHICRIGHVQIADSPARQQPGTGEIAYDFVLARLHELGYTGYVGLEYKASPDGTLASLSWAKRQRQAADGSTRPSTPR